MKKTRNIIITIIAVLGGIFTTSFLAMKAVDFFFSREKKLYNYHSKHLDENIVHDSTAKHLDFKVDDITKRVYITLPNDN